MRLAHVWKHHQRMKTALFSCHFPIPFPIPPLLNFPPPACDRSPFYPCLIFSCSILCSCFLSLKTHTHAQPPRQPASIMLLLLFTTRHSHAPLINSYSNPSISPQCHWPNLRYRCNNHPCSCSSLFW